MRVTILELQHFQYPLTLSEIFWDDDISIITTKAYMDDMLAYDPKIASKKFYIIENIDKDKDLVIKFLIENKTELFNISPIFEGYGSVNEIVKKVKCQKIITIHNINTWFYHRFWSPRSFMDRINMLGIIKNCDYVAVEDFIYNHLKSTSDRLYQKYKFIYIPFTIFQKSKERIFVKEDNRLKVVLTGAIDGDRRKYEDVLEVIEYFKERFSEITFSFAGRAKGDYGRRIQDGLRDYKTRYPELVDFFEDDSTADMFRREMETSDLVLSTSTETFKGLGTVEYIGKTKPTAAIHDMMSYELPGLLPEHLQVPENLKGSVFNYKDKAEIISYLERLLESSQLLEVWKSKAKANSLNFTATEIRKRLPFNSFIKHNNIK
jgi:hypothetical protein